MRTGIRYQVLIQAAFTITQRPFLSVYASFIASTASGLRFFHSSRIRVSRVPSDISRYLTLGRIIGGEWFCDCDRPAVYHEVKKSGPNKGMKCEFS
jgi:hypothetical protein